MILVRGFFWRSHANDGSNYQYSIPKRVTAISQTFPHKHDLRWCAWREKLDKTPTKRWICHSLQGKRAPCKSNRNEKTKPRKRKGKRKTRKASEKSEVGKVKCVGNALICDLCRLELDFWPSGMVKIYPSGDFLPSSMHPICNALYASKLINPLIMHTSFISSCNQNVLIEDRHNQAISFNLGLIGLDIFMAPLGQIKI